MVKRPLMVRWCCCTLIVLGVWAAPGSAACAQGENDSDGGLFERIYTNSVSNLSKPDQTFIDITADPPEKPPVLYAAQSKTCSKRCSTTCSKSCTTTRGCSSNCKSYTDGCGGASTPPKEEPVSGGSSTASQTSLVGTTSAIPRSSSDKFSTRDVQFLLMIAGYSLIPDGDMNSGTQDAIIAYQQQNGLTATGIADDALWQSLCAAITVLGGGSGVTQGNTTPSTGKGKYWINSGTNTRHNASCRYYGTTKAGYYTDEQLGKACGICGG